MHASGAKEDEDHASPPIGGFFEAHDPSLADAEGPSLLEAWTEGLPYAAFVNARSAFAALVASLPKASIWLPAFLCTDMVDASFSARVQFYPVLDGFQPGMRELAAAGPGDVVLVAAHFGAPLGEEVRSFIARRPDLHVVEDRAQALDAGLSAGAGWLLYSPRKLLGVADGGLLVGRAGAALPQPTAPSDSDALWEAPRLRREDPDGRRNAIWYASSRAKEARMGVSSDAMTPASLAVLSRTSLGTLARGRLRNWRALDDHLRAWSALSAGLAAPPLGYVLRLQPERRDRLLKALHAERIFAAVHWPEVAGPAALFPRENLWTRELITLPCDHRYSEADMLRIVVRVTEVLG